MNAFFQWIVDLLKSLDTWREVVVKALGLLAVFLFTLLFRPVRRWLISVSRTASKFFALPAYVRKYKSDIIGGHFWKWEYRDGDVCNLRAFCTQPYCGAPLFDCVQWNAIPSDTATFHGTSLRCNSCCKEWLYPDKFNLPEDVLRQIKVRIKTGSWRKRNRRLPQSESFG
jgi:hypothetical protein